MSACMRCVHSSIYQYFVIKKKTIILSTFARKATTLFLELEDIRKILSAGVWATDHVYDNCNRYLFHCPCLF